MAIVLGPVNTNSHHKRSLSVTALPSSSFHKSSTTTFQVQNKHNRRHSTIVPFPSSSLLVLSTQDENVVNEEQFNNFFDFSLLSYAINDDNCLEQQEEASENNSFVAVTDTTKSFTLHFRKKPTSTGFYQGPNADDSMYDYIYNTPKRRQEETTRSAGVLLTPPPFIMATARDGAVGRCIFEINHEQVPECILMPMCADDDNDDDDDDYPANGCCSSSFSSDDNNSSGSQHRMLLRYRPCATVLKSWQ